LKIVALLRRNAHLLLGSFHRAIQERTSYLIPHQQIGNDAGLGLFKKEPFPQGSFLLVFSLFETGTFLHFLRHGNAKQSEGIAQVFSNSIRKKQAEGPARFIGFFQDRKFIVEAVELARHLQTPMCQRRRVIPI
jgi:hypothetical protein